MKAEIFKDRKKEWRFRFKSGNRKIVLQSEGYKSKRNAIKTVKAINPQIAIKEV